jgi:outer membrane protein OmpA-like peptidoglycan-associated protein
MPVFYTTLRHLTLVALFLFSMFSCGSFPKAIKLLNRGEAKEALPLLEKSKNHPVYGPGAVYYHSVVDLNLNPSIDKKLEVNNLLCALVDDINKLPRKQQMKLSRYKASRGDVAKQRKNISEGLKRDMMQEGTIPQLQLLDTETSCFREGALDSVRKVVVNKRIDPRRVVFGQEKDIVEWKGKVPERPSEEEVYAGQGRSAKALGTRGWQPITYHDLVTIRDEYSEHVLRANYGQFWAYQSASWDVFQQFRPFAEMPEYKKDYPSEKVTYDCWYDDAKEALRSDDLNTLLTFHENTPHTALDIEVCNQVLLLTGKAPEQLESLSGGQLKRILDIKRMLMLQVQHFNCTSEFDSLELIAVVEDLATEYPGHRTVFDLAISTLHYFTVQEKYGMAELALQTFSPVFKDAERCEEAWYFQVSKQKYFADYQELLDRIKNFGKQPATALYHLNTPDNDEYGLVAYGEGKEVFFTRRNHISKAAAVYQSRFTREGWTKPVKVDKLSISDDVLPLSMSEDGRTMLLRSEGQVFQALRTSLRSGWIRPDELPAIKQFGGDAWQSPDGEQMMMSFYSQSPSLEKQMPTDIISIGKNEEGKFLLAQNAGDQVNSLVFSEGNPVMALNGRMLFFNSDREREGLGNTDAYSVSLSKPNDFSEVSEPVNLGLRVNTIFDDAGISYFSEYEGKAYFSRYNRCENDRNLFAYELESEFFPDVLRLAGVVIDENGNKVSKGFVEVTANYDLGAHSQPISKGGTYSYTVEADTRVARLFTEVPGFFSERDTTHFLDDAQPGEIIRDTFRVTSFDHIRQDFQLSHATFLNGTATFDQPDLAYPELTRLAKIAVRMGAELQIEGHTDDQGSAQANQQLSEDRAKSVKAFLVEKCGLLPGIITVKGFGATVPKASNDTEEGRLQNRRVEVKFRMPELRRGR